MVEESYKIIKYISEGKTCNEICSLLNISNKQLYNRLSLLKRSGYYFDRNYFYDGNIIYTLKNPFENNSTNYYINNGDSVEEYKIMLISDTHLGNNRDSIYALDDVFETCIKENINIIFHIGDFFDGIYNEIKDPKAYGIAQISYGLNNYPFDKNILTFLCLGNHDSTFYLEKGIDVSKIISDRRHDIIPIGYGYGTVSIDDIEFILKHAIDRIGLRYPKLNDNHIILKGHSHKFKVTESPNLLTISVPSLSNVNVVNALGYPSYVIMNIKKEGNFITMCHFEQYIYINDKFIKSSEINYNLHYRINTFEEDGIHFSKEIVPKTPDFTRELKKN